MNFKRLKILLCAAATSLLLLISCGKSGELKPDAESIGIEVTECSPVKKNMSEYINLNANTIYQKQEIVRVTFQGYIDKSFKNIGDKIKQNDLLFLIKTKEADAVNNTKAELPDKEFGGVVKIFARTDGVMTELDHQNGDYVADGDQIAVLVDPSSLRVVLEVPFQYAKSVFVNNSYPILLPDGKECMGHIIRIVPSIDPVNQTQKYILQMNNNVDLPANLNVTVKIPVKNSNDAFALPKSSVMSNETQTEFWVMKISNNNTAIKVNIKKGIENDSLIQIIEPQFTLSDKFISEGAFGLPDTAKIFIRNK
jgi:multidrug efflux pump subunit AcrA (membrane-fusion protein)